MTIEHSPVSTERLLLPPDGNEQYRPFWSGYACKAILDLATVRDATTEPNVLAWGFIPRGRGTKSIYVQVTSESEQEIEEGCEEPWLDHVLEMRVSMKGRGTQTVAISTSGTIGTLDGKHFAFDTSPEEAAAAENFLKLFYVSTGLENVPRFTV